MLNKQEAHITGMAFDVYAPRETSHPHRCWQSRFHPDHTTTEYLISIEGEVHV